MTKCIKITPKEVLEVTEWVKDDFLCEGTAEGHALQTPEIWLRRKMEAHNAHAGQRGRDRRREPPGQPHLQPAPRR